jgi:hypothetical protein
MAKDGFNMNPGMLKKAADDLPPRGLVCIVEVKGAVDAPQQVLVWFNPQSDLSFILETRAQTL